jgi:hypothetical protein
MYFYCYVCSVLYILFHCAVLFTVLCKCVLYCTVLYCTVLYCTVLYCTVLYCTVLLLPAVNPIAVIKYIMSHSVDRVS